MADACKPGDGCIRGRREAAAQNLRYAAREHHNGGEIQADVVYYQHPCRFWSGEGKALFQKKQHQEEQHSQKEIVRVYHGKGAFAGKVVEFGELAVKDAARHCKNGV